MTQRSRDTDLLFQRIEAARQGPPDPAVEQGAARAIEAWPLLALLAPRVEALPRSAPARFEIADVSARGAASVAANVLPPVTVAPVAALAPAPFEPAPIMPALTEPAEPHFDAELEPSLAATVPPKPVSPLDQLFARLDRAAAAKVAPPPLEEPAPSPAARIAALRPMTRLPESIQPREMAERARQANEEAAMRLFEKIARH